MTKRSFTPPGAVLVAIDMAKNRQEVLIERPEGGTQERPTVDGPLTIFLRGIHRVQPVGNALTRNGHQSKTTAIVRPIPANNGNPFMANPVPSVGAALGAAVAAVAATAVVIPAAPPPTPPTSSQVTNAAVSDQDAVRLAKQATFGPTPAVIARIKQLGIEGWLDEQFTLKTSSYSDLSALAVSNAYCDRSEPGNQLCFRKYRDSLLPAMRFYKNAVEGDDQLRQRVALALFSIMPVSALKNPNTAGLAKYQQIMLDNAFGNYGDLLRSVVRSGAMGSYLDMNGSTMRSPNENMGRELMQLFSLGSRALNDDGTERTDETGAAVENYTAADVAQMSRALTGWEPARFPGYNIKDNAGWDFSGELQPNPALYDTSAKTFLGVTVPAGTDQVATLDIIVKRLLTHPSTAPHVSLRLIRSLVKSNPTPSYVARISGVFRDSGGNLRATIRAILTDPEARTVDTGVQGGKLKDPQLLMTSVARLTGMNTDGYAFTVRDVQMGQQFLRAPSVFGDYPPDYPLAGTNLVSPQSKLMTVGSIAARSNFVWQWVMSGTDARAEYVTPTWVPNRSDTREDLSQWEALGDDVNAMADRINLLMLDGRMTAEQRAALVKAMTLVTNTSPQLRARLRAQTGLYIAASSPQFQIDR